MGRVFDIERRTQSPKSTPAKQRPGRQPSSCGTFLLMSLVLLIGWVSYQTVMKSNQTTPLPDPSSTLPTTQPVTPSLTSIIPSVTPSSEPSPPIVTPTDAPTTPPPSPDLQALQIRILNASGKAGQASQLKNHLETNGLSIRYIAVAKSKKDTTTVYFEPEHEAAAHLIGALIPNRTVAYQEDSALTAPDDILIIVGIN